MAASALFVPVESDGLTLSALQTVYDLLHVLPFDNVRKRSSVIVRKQGEKQITLFMKGAESMVDPSTFTFLFGGRSRALASGCLGYRCHRYCCWLGRRMPAHTPRERPEKRIVR